MKLPSTMRSLSTVLNCFPKGYDGIRLHVVLSGKVKPVEFELHEVLADGLILRIPVDEEVTKLYPYAAISSIEVGRTPAP